MSDTADLQRRIDELIAAEFGHADCFADDRARAKRVVLAALSARETPQEPSTLAQRLRERAKGECLVWTGSTGIVPDQTRVLLDAADAIATLTQAKADSEARCAEAAQAAADFNLVLRETEGKLEAAEARCQEWRLQFDALLAENKRVIDEAEAAEARCVELARELDRVWKATDKGRGYPGEELSGIVRDYKLRAEQAEQRLAVMEGAREWQPIETAPKDGTEVLLTDGHYKRTGYWARRANVWSMDAVVSLKPPTHWMPLPALALATPAVQAETPHER